MLMPKRTKWRRQQRGRIRGEATRGNTVAFGDFGLQFRRTIQNRHVLLFPSNFCRHLPFMRRRVSRRYRRGRMHPVVIFLKSAIGKM